MIIASGIMKKTTKRMFSQVEEMKECAHGNKEFCFLAGQESWECCVSMSDIVIYNI